MKSLQRQQQQQQQKDILLLKWELSSETLQRVSSEFRAREPPELRKGPKLNHTN